LQHRDGNPVFSRRDGHASWRFKKTEAWQFYPATPAECCLSHTKRLLHVGVLLPLLTASAVAERTGFGNTLKA